MNYEIPIHMLKDELSRMIRVKLDQEERKRYNLREDERLAICNEFCRKLIKHQEMLAEQNEPQR